MILYRTPGRSFTRPPRTSTMECSCRLWPTPGIYVVTSIAFVSRTRATLRSAEFGFFGVCVYTRMHTPRFSGQPASAGDFVFIRTASRPILTSCENVGTVVPHFARNLSRLPQRAHTISRERSPVLKGLRRIRRYNQQETPYALQEAEHFSWLQFGEAYSALRGWRPIPAALLSHSVLLCSGTEDKSLPTQRLRTNRSRPTQGKLFPDKHRSIGIKSRPVKSFDTSRWKTLLKSGALAFPLPCGAPNRNLYAERVPRPVRLC